MAVNILVDNVGSAARDYCMLERNLLSHLKLAVVLSLMASSLLLHVRLVPDGEPELEHDSKTAFPLAILQFIGAIFAILAGVWEYRNGYRDLMQMRVFLAGTKQHLVIMAVVTAVIFTTCVVLLVDER